jgi:hypothetical protein
MADDHAAHAIGAYGSRVNRTPGIDRLPDEGMRFDNCFCTNSLCHDSARRARSPDAGITTAAMNGNAMTDANAAP